MRDRLGEMLVIRGLLAPQQLRYALAHQKASGGHLGKILIQEHMVSRRALYGILLEQWTKRCLVGLFMLTLTFSAPGSKQLQAGVIKDIPAQVRLTRVANKSFEPMGRFPALFGSDERRSQNLEPFTKWTGMFARFETAMREPHGQAIIRKWQQDLMAYRDLTLRDMAEKVNDQVNAQKYIVDSRNWGTSDYWATPVEFFTRGGDCEDFAIAKYTALRALGVPEERLRIAIVHDNQKNIPHAVLIVYTDSDSLMLDSQIKTMRSSRNVSRYRPIFSINRDAWWLHTKPDATVLASAD